MAITHGIGRIFRSKAKLNTKFVQKRSSGQNLESKRQTLGSVITNQWAKKIHSPKKIPPKSPKNSRQLPS